MKNIELANDIRLFELDTLIKTPDDAEDLSIKLRNLSTKTKLDLMKDYNDLTAPDLKMSAIVVNCIGTSRERTFNENESKEVCDTLARCAAYYVLNGASDEQKRDLGRTLKYFVIGHPENASAVLDTLDKFLTNVDVIEPIRSCMSRDHSLFDKGFKAIHKSADAICTKAKEAGKKEPHFAASEQIRLAFADLYHFGTPMDSVAMLDRITKEFPSFEDQIRRGDASSLKNQCEWEGWRTKNDFMRCKLEILHDTFDQFGHSDKHFSEIYKSETAKRQDELARLAFKEKVAQKVKSKSEALTAQDEILLDKISKPHEYTTLKRAGNIEFNKMLMSAHRQAKEETK